jgi:hypothetical protein
MRHSIKYLTAFGLLALTASACTGMPSADESSAQESAAVGAKTPRRPHGLYADVNISDFIAANFPGQFTGQDAAFNTLYASLLANPAVSGLSLRIHWSSINPVSQTAFDWGYVDDAFQQVSTFNQVNGTSKTIQVLVVPGFDTPSQIGRRSSVTGWSKNPSLAGHAACTRHPSTAACSPK